jgi:hypothetical protein
MKFQAQALIDPWSSNHVNEKTPTKSDQHQAPLAASAQKDGRQSKPCAKNPLTFFSQDRFLHAIFPSIQPFTHTKYTHHFQKPKEKNATV